MLVYAIRASESGRIKVGITGKMKRRLAACRTSCPEPLSVVGVLEVPDERARDIEREIHWRYREHRVTGEWFNPSPELLAEISSWQQWAAPAKRSTERLSGVLQIRISSDQKAAYRSAAAAAGMTLTGWMKKVFAEAI
jgi:hypothetical protein